MPPLILPIGFNPDNVPAIVLYSDDHKTALCWHPLSPTHPNLIGTVARLERMRVRVLNAPLVRAAAA